MKSLTQILPGVRAVYWVDCAKLPNRVDLRGICRMPVNILTDYPAVAVAPGAKCSCVSEREGRGFRDTASLSFLCDVQLPDYLHVGFVVEDVKGNTFLIGSKEPPFPQVKFERNLGDTDGDSAGFYCEVTHVALKSLIPCIIAN